MAEFELLLKAPSKELVEQIFLQAHMHGRSARAQNLSSSEPVFPIPILKKIAEALETTPPLAQSLLLAAAQLIEEAVFENLPAAEIGHLLPESLNKSLKQLIAAIVAKNMPKWRETASSTQISLPRLVSTDWRVDVKTSSDSFSRMAQPAILMDMKVQATPTRSNAMPEQRHITFELNKETLDTMLDGLGKIRDQLASITAAQ